MFYLKQSTAGQKISVKLVDSVNGYEAELSITSPTATISKVDGCWATGNDDTWAEIGGAGNGKGWYTYQVDATDTATLGKLAIHIEKIGCRDFDDYGYVLPANIYDSWFSTDKQQVDITQIAGAAVNTASAQIGVNIVSEDNIDFGATKKTSLNEATPAATVSDKTGFKLASDGVDGLSVGSGDIKTIKDKTDNLPASPAPSNEYDVQLDANVSTRATSAKQITMETTLGIVAVDVAGINGEAMRGTDGVSLVIPDAAGVAAALHTITDALILVNLAAIGNLDDTTAAQFVAALMADTGITAGGSWTYEKIMKVIVSIISGNIQDKSGSSGTYEILDPDDGTTVIGELIPATSTPYRNLTIL